MVYRILVGSYNDEIYTLTFDPVVPSVEVSLSVTVGHHPSWVTKHPSDPFVIYTGVEQSDGRIVTLKYDTEGRGTILQNISSGGDSPCTLIALEDQLVVGNYMSGSVVVFPTLDGPRNPISSGAQTLDFTGSGPNQQRQESPHPHQVIFHREGNELLVPDLGADRTQRLRRDTNGSWKIEGAVHYVPASGPRHVALYGGILYTVTELSNEVTAHRLPPLPEEPTFITSAPTMREFPPTAKESGMLAAEILIPPPNDDYPIPLIYVSNRNDPSPDGDVISIFSIVHPEELEPVAEIRTGLNHLRGMAFGGPSNKYLVAGGVTSGKIKVFERVDKGRGLVELTTVEAVAPTAFLWL